MPAIDLKYAIGLTPKKAIKYFESKGNKISWDWHDTLDDAHAKAFTVAKVAKADILQDIRNEVDKAIKEGKGFKDFQNNLEPLLKQKGWWGEQIIVDSKGTAQKVQLGSTRRLQLIYDTNIQVAFQQGRYKNQLDAAPLKPYWQYLTKDDGRVRPAHAALHEKVFRFDDPFWDHFYPPNGFRCRCRVKALSEKNIKDKNLEVDSAEGKLLNVERRLGDKTYINTQYRVHTKDGYQNITPDAGWNYNPGKAPNRLELRKEYDPDINKQLQKALDQGNIKHVPPVNSIEELETWTSNNIKATVSNIKATDIDNAREYIDAIATAEKDFNIKIPSNIEFGPLEKAASSQYNPENNIITLNHKNIDYKAFYQADNLFFSKFDKSIPSSVTDSKKALFFHELAHSIDHNNDLKYRKAISNLTEEEKDYLFDNISGIARQNLLEADDPTKLGGETFAECFAAYISNHLQKKNIPPVVLSLIIEAIEVNSYDPQ